MNIVWAKIHRLLTLGYLRYALNNVPQRQHYAPVPLRMLYVPASCLPYHVSGYTTRTHAILTALMACGADIHILTRTGYPWDRSDRLIDTEQESTLVDTVRYAHIRQARNTSPTAIYAARAAKVIAHYAQEHQVGCIHAASNHVNALPALIAARQLGIPFQYEIRGLWEMTRASRMPAFENSYNYRLGLDLEAFVAAHADRVFVISQQLGEYIHQHWNIPKECLSLLPNCVDGERIKPDPTKEMLPNTIGYAGSLICYEGLDTLIEAVASLVRQGKEIHLRIIGDGEARADLQALSARLGMQEYVHFFGRLAPDEARAHICACALVCIPRKPFQVCQMVPPIKLVEAQALGKAVIVPDLPLFREEMGPEPGGWFFHAGDAEHLAKVVADALALPVRLAEVGALGRKNVLARRQWTHFVEDIVKGQGQCLEP